MSALGSKWSVVLSGAVFPGRKRPCAVAVDVTEAQADALAHEYRATGWTVSVVRGPLDGRVMVPGRKT